VHAVMFVVMFVMASVLTVAVMFVVMFVFHVSFVLFGCKGKAGVMQLGCKERKEDKIFCFSPAYS